MENHLRSAGELAMRAVNRKLRPYRLLQHSSSATLGAIRLELALVVASQYGPVHVFQLLSEYSVDKDATSEH